MEGAQLSVWQEQAAAIQNIPTLNFVKKDTIEMLKAVIGDGTAVFIPSSTQSKLNTAM